MMMVRAEYYNDNDDEHDNEFQHLCIPGKESGRGMARADVDLIVPGALK